MAGLSMFLVGFLMEAGQHFSPGRAVEFGDVLANDPGVSCGVLLAAPIPPVIASCAVSPTGNLKLTL